MSPLTRNITRAHSGLKFHSGRDVGASGSGILTSSSSATLCTCWQYVNSFSRLNSRSGFVSRFFQPQFCSSALADIAFKVREIRPRIRVHETWGVFLLCMVIRQELVIQRIDCSRPTVNYRHEAHHGVKRSLRWNIPENIHQTFREPSVLNNDWIKTSRIVSSKTAVRFRKISEKYIY